MKICVANSNQGGLQDIVSQNFGRCPSFTIVNVEDKKIKEVEVVLNPGASAGSGAGIQAAQTVVDGGCNAIIAGAIGPNSFQVLSIAKLDVRECLGMTVERAIEEYLSGRLRSSSGTGRGPGRSGQGRGTGRGHGGPGDEKR
jgi:predicted Fe-Mo cluster-binding NifX family protein